MSDQDIPEEDLARINRMAEIAYEAVEWVNRVAHNDYAHSQMMRTIHFTLWGEDIGEDAA